MDNRVRNWIQNYLSDDLTGWNDSATEAIEHIRENRDLTQELSESYANLEPTLEKYNQRRAAEQYYIVEQSQDISKITNFESTLESDTGVRDANLIFDDFVVYFLGRGDKIEIPDEVHSRERSNPQAVRISYLNPKIPELGKDIIKPLKNEFKNFKETTLETGWEVNDNPDPGKYVFLPLNSDHSVSNEVEINENDTWDDVEDRLYCEAIKDRLETDPKTMTVKFHGGILEYKGPYDGDRVARKGSLGSPHLITGIQISATEYTSLDNILDTVTQLPQTDKDRV